MQLDGTTRTDRCARRRPAGRKRRLGTSLLVGVAATLLVACGSDGASPLSSIEPPDQVAGATTPDGPAPETAPATPAPEQPAPEQPAPEASAPAQPSPALPTGETESESLTTEEWIAVILLGLLAVVAVIGIGALLTRDSKKGPDNSRQLRLDDITRSSRSIHDHTVLAVLQTADSASLPASWSVAQQQLFDVEGRVAALTSETTDPNAARTLQDLGTAIAGVRGALGSNVAVRLGPSADTGTGLVEQSQRIVVERNQQLDAAINRALQLRL